MKTLRIFAVALVLAVPSLALAFTAQGGETLNITAPVSDDLYAAGSRVAVESPITGDLNMAGGDVSSKWGVSESIMAAGWSIDLSGNVGDDVRAAGGNIRIHNSTVTGDMVLAGGNIDIQKDVIVGKDLVVAGGNIYLDGAIRGKTQIMGGKVYLNGIINKDANITAEEIIVSSGAQIRGNLVYKSLKTNPALEGIVSGTKQFTEMPVNEKSFENPRSKMLGFVFSYILLKILFLTVFGFILYTFMGKYIRETSDIVKTAPWNSLFTGIAFFVLVPIVAVLLMFTIIGIPFGVLMLAVLCFVFAFYELIGTVVWASWTIDRYMKGQEDSWWRKLLVIFGFALLFGIISGIDIIPAWMAIGALLTRHWRLVESIRK